MTFPHASRRPVRVAVGALASAAVLSILAASAAAAPASLPTTLPSDAAAAKVTVQSRTISKYTTTTKGENGYATVTLTPPAGKQILQGFATMTGGNATASIIQSTQVVGSSRYVVKLLFPGQQGKPGVLHVQLQLLPKQ
jgi:hypothetical protein